MTKKQTVLLGTFGAIAIVAVFTIVAAATILHNRGALPPERVVALFYDEWVEEANDDPSKPFDTRLHERSIYVTPALAGTIKSEYVSEQRDSVLCTANIPALATTVLINESDTQASVAVNNDQNIRFARVVMVRDDRGWWRMDEIDCEIRDAKPEPSASSTEYVPEPSV